MEKVRVGDSYELVKTDENGRLTGFVVIELTETGIKCRWNTGTIGTHSRFLLPGESRHWADWELKPSKTTRIKQYYELLSNKV